MTISVLIPVYNHAKELIQAIRSLDHQTHAPHEIIVVDDGSSDHPEQALREAGMLNRVRFSRLAENRGAPVARNTAFAQSTGEAVIFLDADADLRADALDRLHAALLADTEAAFAYSAFRFGKKLFRSQVYSVEALKRGNFIHTSALIRRTAFPGFDPDLKKFQDWDLWLQLAEQGRYGVYVPELLMTFAERVQGGMSRWIPSFAYRLPWALIGYEPEVVRRYREAEQIIRRKHAHWMSADASRALVRATSTRMWLFLGLALWGVSMLSLGTWANGVLAIIIALGVGVCAVFRPELALGWVALELLIGSKGGLLKWGSDAVNDGGIGLRVLQFVALMVGWAVWALRTGAWQRLLERRRMLASVAAVAMAIAYGVIRGFALHQPFVFADANAWGVLLLVLPVFSLERAALERVLRPSIRAGISLLVGITLALFFVFSHSLPAGWLESVYLWVRRSGLGEITRAGGSIFRIFLQSQIYLLPAWLWLWVRAWRDHLPLGWRTWIAWIAISASILASFSRSFWLGLASACLVGCVLLFGVATSWRERLIALARPFGAFIGGGLLLALLAFLPFFPGEAGLSTALRSRFVGGEAAVSSRWSLLPKLQAGIGERPWAGSGFGATLTYVSSDPRVVQSTGGTYTTYAFEWGWLDLWYKLGVFGLAAILWWLVVIAVEARQQTDRSWIWTSLFLLVTVHIFTPYINHPLGIGLLIVLFWWSVSDRAEKEKSPGR
jgi:glycosyltransferase involved in cell wall biosynthesis